MADERRTMSIPEQVRSLYDEYRADALKLTETERAQFAERVRLLSADAGRCDVATRARLIVLAAWLGIEL